MPNTHIATLPKMGGKPVSFDDMTCVSSYTLEVLRRQGFTQATPVQEAVVPLFCSNKDVAVDAATGSGKTLAFVIPIVERLRRFDGKPKPSQVLAMIVSPTRELARQIHKVAEPFFRGMPDCHLCSLIGGTDVTEDVSAIQVGANCVIGTPGRIDDTMKRVQSLSYKHFEVLVLDEADRLLEMGFQKQLDSIMSRLPKQRRTGLFSATQTDAVEALVRAGLRNPYRVNVAVTQRGEATKQKTPSTLSIEYMLVKNDAKLGQLLAFLNDHSKEKIIVYFLTCASVDYFAELIPQLPGGNCMPLLDLHGNMKQRKRTEVLQEYADTEAGALLCTDLAARGLDIPDVHWIVQFDPPQNPANFVHRCGRTARMGRSGNALAMLLPHEESYVDLLRNRNVPMVERAASKGATTDTSAAARSLAERDRALLEKGAKAFVSYVRGYKEHQCKFIFQMSDLDMCGLGRMFGLLRLPVMKEVRKSRKGLQDFKQSEVDPDAVPYKDPKREAARQKALKKAQAEGTDRASLKAEREQKRLEQAAAHAKKSEEKKLPAAKRQMMQKRQDQDDLDDDYRLLKKLKKGKLSGADYDKQMGILDD